MDIEVSSLGILVTVNLIIFIGIGIYLRFFYKWDNKQYDDMAVNLDNYRRNTYGNELFLGEGASNIESLLGKDDTLVQFQGNQPSKGYGAAQNMPLELSSMPSKIGSFHRNSLFTIDRAQSILQFGSQAYMTSQPSEYNFEFGHKEEGDGGGEMMTVERPQGWFHLFKTLYSIDELRLLKRCNSDGYFYLLYLKSCAWTFSLLTLLSCCIMLPLYHQMQDEQFPFAPAQISELDALTLADSIKNKQIIWLVVLFTFQFSIVAYYMVYKFCQQMSSFEFQPNQQYIDSFVSTHTIMIRGVNQNIGVEEADSLIRKVFEERFGPKQVISVSTIRETDNVQQLYRKRQVYKQRLSQFQMQNHYQEFREKIWVGSRLKCTRRLVDAEKYYTNKYEEAEEEWENLKKKANEQNVGVSFVSFKDKDCVSDTIEEMDLVKTKLVGKKHYDTLDIRNWEVEMAIPTNDIIWTELNKGVSRSLPTRMILNLLLLTLSTIVIFGIIFIDQELESQMPSFILVAVKYLTPLALSLFTFYTIPWLIYKVVQFERHEIKSEKEESFMSKNSMLMTLNSLVVPLIICAFFSSLAPSIVVEDKYPSTPKQPKNVLNVTDDPLSEIFPKPMTFPLNSTNATSEEAKQPATTSQTHANETQTAFTVLYYEVINQDFNDFFSLVLAYGEELFIRYLLQIILLIIVYQMWVPPEKIMKAFHQMLFANGKTKFKSLIRLQHWFYDLGFRNSIAISVFTMTLFFSIIVPIILPIGTLAFFIGYYIDKYNMIYVYPIDFETKSIYRKTLVIHSILAIILFQLVMFLIAGTVLNKRVSIYLFAYLVIQLMVLFTTFEFIRKPWEGKELEIERIQQLQANNLFESISSMHTGFEDHHDPSTINDMGYTQKAKQEKQVILQKAYQSPFDAFFQEDNQEQDDFQGVDDLIGEIASPKSSMFGGLGEAIRPRNSGPFVNHRVSLDEITKRYPVPTDDVVKEDVANEDITLNGSKSMIKFKKETCKSSPTLLTLPLAPKQNQIFIYDENGGTNTFKKSRSPSKTDSSTNQHQQYIEEL